MRRERNKKVQKKSRQANSKNICANHQKDKKIISIKSNIKEGQQLEKKRCRKRTHKHSRTQSIHRHTKQHELFFFHYQNKCITTINSYLSTRNI